MLAAGPDGGGHHRGAGPNRPVGQAVSRSGARCATCRRATSCTSGRSTATSSKPSRGQAHSPPGCRGRTCWCSARWCTTSARAAAATTASSAPSWPPRSAPGWGCGRRTSRCCPRSCATTCCCPHTATRRDLQDPKTIAAVVDALGRRPGAAGAAARAGRGGLAGHRARRVGRLEGVADRRPGAPLPAGDGGRAAAASRSDRAAVSCAGRRRRRARRADPGRQPAHLQRHDDRAGPPGPAVQGRRRAGAELAAGALGVGQRPRGRRRSTRSSCRRTSARRPPPSCCASSSSSRSTANSTCSARSNAVTATPRARAPPAPGRYLAAVPINHAAAPPRILWFDGTVARRVVVQIRSHRPRRAAGAADRGLRTRRRRHRLGQGHHPGFVGRRRVRHRRAALTGDGTAELGGPRRARARPVRGAARAAACQAGVGGQLTGLRPGRADPVTLGLTACLNPCPTG